MFEYTYFFALQLISKGGKFFFEIAPSFIMNSTTYGEYVYLGYFNSNDYVEMYVNPDTTCSIYSGTYLYIMELP